MSQVLHVKVSKYLFQTSTNVSSCYEKIPREKLKMSIPLSILWDL